MANWQNRRGIYAITDPVLLQGATLYERVEAALREGLCLLQYRNKSAIAEQQLIEARHLLTLCHRYNTPLLINDDLELCLKVGADGVHLGQSDAGLKQARTLLGKDAIIGITCHSDLDRALKAEADGASYVAFGRFHPSSTKPHAPHADIRILPTAKARVKLPIVAIGGINADNGSPLVAAGADMLAVIHYLFAYPDVSERVRQLKQCFRTDACVCD